MLDLGGVLVDWDPVPAVVAAVGEDEARRFFAATDFDFFAWNARQDAGRTFAEAEAEVAATHPHWVEHVRGYLPNFAASLLGQHDDTVAVLREVAATGTPVHALTNWSAETWHHAEERFGFLRLFDQVLVSGALRMAKPDPEVFEELVRRTGLPAERMFFTDDSPRNVEAARAFGLDAVLFADGAALRDVLVSRGVLA